LIAVPAFWPRIKSTTSRAFCGDVRTYLASALAIIFLACSVDRSWFPVPGYDGFAVFSVGAPPDVGAAAAFTEWPRNWRVGENSPSFRPTMFSVMYTGINFLPLWTASVCPMNSGTMVERRDHVRTTFFSLFSFITATFFARWSSVNGPFFSDLLIV
jgi:hypothetical protein